MTPDGSSILRMSPSLLYRTFVIRGWKPRVSKWKSRESLESLSIEVLSTSRMVSAMNPPPSRLELDDRCDCRAAADQWRIRHRRTPASPCLEVLLRSIHRADCAPPCT